MEAQQPQVAAREPRPGMRSRLASCLFALAIGAASMAIRAALPLWGSDDSLPFVFAFPAVALVAFWFGTVEGALTAAVSAVWVWLPGVPPSIPEPDGPLQIGLFLVAAVVVAIACGRVGKLAPVREAGVLPVGKARRAALIALGAAFVVAMLVGVAGLKVMQAQTGEAVRGAVEQAVTGMRRLVVHHRIVAESVASIPELRRGDALTDATRAQLAAELTAIAARSPEIVSISVWDVSGRPVVASERATPAERLDRGLLAAHAVTNAPTVTVDGPVAAAGRRLLQETYSREVAARFAGVVRIETDADAVGRLLAGDGSLPQGVVLQLLRQDGQEIARAQGPGRTARIDDAARRSLVERALAGNVETGPHLGWFAAAERMSTWRVVLAAALPERTAEGRWLANLWTLLTFVLPTAFVLLWMGWKAVARNAGRSRATPDAEAAAAH